MLGHEQLDVGPVADDGILPLAEEQGRFVAAHALVLRDLGRLVRGIAHQAGVAPPFGPVLTQDGLAVGVDHVVVLDEQAGVADPAPRGRFLDVGQLELLRHALEHRQVRRIRVAAAQVDARRVQQAQRLGAGRPAVGGLPPGAHQERLVQLEPHRLDDRVAHLLLGVAARVANPAVGQPDHAGQGLEVQVDHAPPGCAFGRGLTLAQPVALRQGVHLVDGQRLDAFHRVGVGTGGHHDLLGDERIEDICRDLLVEHERPARAVREAHAGIAHREAFVAADAAGIFDGAHQVASARAREARRAAARRRQDGIDDPRALSAAVKGRRLGAAAQRALAAVGRRNRWDRRDRGRGAVGQIGRALACQAQRGVVVGSRRARGGSGQQGEQVLQGAAHVGDRRVVGQVERMAHRDEVDRRGVGAHRRRSRAVATLVGGGQLGQEHLQRLGDRFGRRLDAQELGQGGQGFRVHRVTSFWVE